MRPTSALRALRPSVELPSPSLSRTVRPARLPSHQNPSPSRPLAQRSYSSYTSTHISKPPRHGQPLSSTHPRSIQDGHLTPHVPRLEYEERRKRLMQSLPEGSVVVCMGGTTRLMTQQIFYKFRQSTDFFYLTGFAEPDAVLVLESRPSTSRGYKMTLFVAPKDPQVALWAGECSGVEGAVSLFGADEAHPHTAFSSFLPTYLRAPHIYASLPPSPSPSPASQPFQPPPPRKRSSLLKLFSSDSSSSSSSSSTSILGASMTSDPPHLLLAAALAGEKAQPLEREVQRLRLVKSKVELGIMKRAADISAAGHRRVMRAAQEGMPEGRLVAEFEYECGLGGSERPAYVPVVASGPNCLVIHYVTNDNYLDPGEMVLIDAGCEYAHYASDLTRTFPVSGRFSEPQRDLYTAVLNAQQECVKRCTVENSVSLNELHRASCGLLLQELRQIGFKLSVGDVERTLYPHFLSHHLGSDLHDCPTSDRNATLVEGNIITIEPGIYVPFDNSFPKHFHGMGVRVEDEVAFRRAADGGPWVLSENAPKEIADVEKACQD